MHVRYECDACAAAHTPLQFTLKSQGSTGRIFEGWAEVGAGQLASVQGRYCRDIADTPPGAEGACASAQMLLELEPQRQVKVCSGFRTFCRAKHSAAENSACCPPLSSWNGRQRWASGLCVRGENKKPLKNPFCSPCCVYRGVDPTLAHATPASSSLHFSAANARPHECHVAPPVRDST